jgi:hypothetical protein
VDAGEGVVGGVFESVAVAFEGVDVGVVEDAVDRGGGNCLVAEDVAPAAKGRLLVKISEACSWRLETSWKNKFAASCSKGR